ncbi:hypothetical protein BGW39_003606 [Mortierella sp. 14UC]|nr:hypothetical protein BGW39_003606 [Mortierella sp. 14UC]
MGRLVAQVDNLSYQISELTLRSQFLRRPDEIAQASVIDDQFSAKGSTCVGAALIINNLVDMVINHVTSLLGDSLENPVAGILNMTIQPIRLLISSINFDAIGAAAGAIFPILETAIGLLKSLSLGPLSMVIMPIVSVLEKIETILRTVIICKSGFNQLPAALAIQPKSCSLMADIYRSTLAEAAAGYVNLLMDVTGELQRYLQGAKATLDNASKTSIATTNEALLAVRSIFSADILKRHRLKILRNSGDSDSIKKYAFVDLGSVVAFSNGLEACLLIATDPAAAAEDIDEEGDEDEESDD